MNRRTALVWRWSVLSVLCTAAAAAAVVWIAREDDRAVAPGERDVEGLTDELARSLPADAPTLLLRDVSALVPARPQFAGPRGRELPEDMGGGLALADLDGDGDLDLLVVGTAPLPNPGVCQLLRNDTPAGETLSFTDVTETAGLPADVTGMGAAVIDADGDGDLDVVVSHASGVRFLRNDGDLRFSDITTDAGLAGDFGWCSGVAVGDADADGDLDLYVCRYVNYSSEVSKGETAQYGRHIPSSLNPSSFDAVPNLLFLNDGDGKCTFTGGLETAQAFGVENPTGRSLGALFADFDHDGRTDIYVANDVSDNAMLQGQAPDDAGTGPRYADVSYESATADYRGAMGLAIADVDGDSDDELFVTHWIAQENGFYRNLLIDSRGVGGRLLFMDDADRVGLGAVALDAVGWATDFVDLDLDGRLDLFVANGSTLEEETPDRPLVRERPFVFWNAGDSGFFDVGTAWGQALGTPRVLRGGAAGDLDRDGDLELVFGTLEGGPLVLLNEGAPRGRPLRVTLRGRTPNRFGVGARVTVECGETRQTRDMRSAPGYLTAGPLELVFGLGAATNEATVIVVWPDGEETRVRAEADVREIEVVRP